ncbi:hypothetical protein [Roseateles sp. DC23W]
MTRLHTLPSRPVSPGGQAMAAALLMTLAGAAAAQATGAVIVPPNAAQAAVIQSIASQLQGASSARALLQGLKANSLPAGVEGVVAGVAGGSAGGDALRVLNPPSQCVPRSNRLDCAAQGATDAGGADVSSRLRHSVIGEVGAGRSATEGAGAPKSGPTCTPLPGKLTCER